MLHKWGISKSATKILTSIKKWEKLIVCTVRKCCPTTWTVPFSSAIGDLAGAREEKTWRVSMNVQLKCNKWEGVIRILEKIGQSNDRENWYRGGQKKYKGGENITEKSWPRELVSQSKKFVLRLKKTNEFQWKLGWLLNSNKNLLDEHI